MAPWTPFMETLLGIFSLKELSGFLKRALAQTCLLAWYQVRFLDQFLGIPGALRMGKGAPLVRYLCTTWKSLHMFFTEIYPLGGTKYVSLELFLSILRGPGEGRGGAPATVPLQNQEVTSRKACLRNAEITVLHQRNGGLGGGGGGGAKRTEVRGVGNCFLWGVSL